MRIGFFELVKDMFDIRQYCQKFFSIYFLNNLFQKGQKSVYGFGLLAIFRGLGDDIRESVQKHSDGFRSLRRTAVSSKILEGK